MPFVNGIGSRTVNISESDQRSSYLSGIVAQYRRALTAEELADLLAVPQRQSMNKPLPGQIPSFRIGTLLRFDPQKVVDWLEKQVKGESAS